VVALKVQAKYLKKIYDSLLNVSAHSEMGLGKFLTFLINSKYAYHLKPIPYYLINTSHLTPIFDFSLLFGR